MATDKPGFFAELKRRNVLRAIVLYVGAVWALAQGVSQLTPAIGLPDLATRWFLVVCLIGFPFWIAFAWYYELTPHGFRREAEVAADAPIRHSNARKLDFAIIAVLAVAVVLLASGYFIHRNAPAAAIGAKSIAVLPFENLSSEKQNDYFVAGMQDLVLTKLADVGSLKVISRTSTMQYKSHPEDLKKVGEQLGVATILEGSVQKAGNEVLINVQLIDAQTDSHIWAESYTRTLDNIFGVEGEVAGKIATALKAKLSPAQSAQLAAVPTTNRAAYDAFLRGEYQVNQGDVRGDTTNYKAAISLYRQAVKHDPAFALAWARLSKVESELAFFGGGGEDIAQLKQQARADAEQALKLQPELPAAQLALGYCDYWGDGNYAAALKAFGAVLASRPNDADALAAQGYVLRRVGRFDEAIASLTKAVTLDPRHYRQTLDLADTYLWVRRYADAESWYQRALALEPDGLNAMLDYSGAILYGTGDIPRALAVLQGNAPELRFQRAYLLRLQRKFSETIALLQGIPDTADSFGPGSTKAFFLAINYWAAGDQAMAKVSFAEALKQDRAALPKTQGPDLADLLSSVAREEIGSGDIAAGLATIAKSNAILAQGKDPFLIVAPLWGDAAASALAGRADLAVQMLAKVLVAPGAGGLYSPVLLWLDPVWDPIRKDSRFQALLKQYAKYKPAVTYDNPPPAGASSTAGR